MAKICIECGGVFNLRDRKTCSRACAAARMAKSNKRRSGSLSGRYRHGATAVAVPGRKSPEYNSWRAMKARCLDPANAAFSNYGGRGISVCEEWIGERGFENFLAYMGPKPSPDHSIDRYPNNDGNYELGNVRWATRQEQSENKRERKRPTHCRRGHPRIPENRMPNGVDDGGKPYDRCGVCWRERRAAAA